MTVALVTDEQAAASLPVGDAVPIVESALRSLAAGRAIGGTRQNLGTRLGNARESVLKLSAGVFEDRSIAGVRIASGVLDVFCHYGHVYGSSVGAAAGGRYFGAVLLVDTTTGEPIALVQDWHLTQLAVSTCAAIAAGCLARANVRSIGVLGAGVQARCGCQRFARRWGQPTYPSSTPRRGDAAGVCG